MKLEKRLFFDTNTPNPIIKKINIRDTYCLLLCLNNHNREITLTTIQVKYPAFEEAKNIKVTKKISTKNPNNLCQIFFEYLILNATNAIPKLKYIAR